MSDRADALILPSDAAISETELKKSVLFFDSVTLANPSDAALVNDGEVVEKFPNLTCQWAPRNNFPREPDYVPKLEHLLASTSELRKKGILRITPSRPFQYLDPGLNYTLWHSAIAEPLLVNAAVPDRHLSLKPKLGIAGYMAGMVMAQSGFTSKYEVKEMRPSARLSDADEFWSLYAHLRIGRFLKFIRLAHGLSLVPLAIDAANQNLLSVSAKSLDTTDGNPPQPKESFPSLAMHLDIFDPAALASTLDAMSWQDVIDLRNQLQPNLKNLRAEMFKLVRKSRGLDQHDLESYRLQLDKLKNQFDEKKEKVSEAWEKLRIAALTKGGGAASAPTLAEVAGLVAFTTGAPWIDLLARILSSGLIATAALSGELQNLLPAQRAVKNHALYFVEQSGIKVA